VPPRELVDATADGIPLLRVGVVRVGVKVGITVVGIDAEDGEAGVMTHKYRGCIVVLSINKSVEPNKEQKVLTSGFDQSFTVNTSKRVFRGIW
jgi:hypothetical protein